MVYGKKEAVMTRGLAIVSMICLHMFCKLGSDIMCQPLIWINDEKPFVYWIGFFSEICVPIYSICAGYAQYLLFTKNKSKFKDNCKRLFKILKNYWIILIVFCLIGLIVKDSVVPGSFTDFIEHFFLLSTDYNGAWWFLQTYVILLFIPSFILMFPVKKINGYLGIVLLIAFDIVKYFFEHYFSVFPHTEIKPLAFIFYLLSRIIQVLPFFWIGAFLCKVNAIEKIERIIKGKISSQRVVNLILIFACVVAFVLTNIINKAGVIGIDAVFIFLAFNLIKKSKPVESLFLFLGKHSTNIWLCHMFFYLTVFTDLVWKAKYPVFVFLFMMVLCIVTSYVEMFISKGIDKSFDIIKKRRKTV